MQVAELRIYPVKSASGRDVEQAVLHPWGLDEDRRWMVVDEFGTTLTAREHRRMLHIGVEPAGDDAIRLTATGRDPLLVAAPFDAEAVALTLSRIDRATDAGPAASAWLTDFLGLPVRLVWLDDPRRRTVGAHHGGRSGDVLSFADAGPVLLTSTVSLHRLDAWMSDLATERAEPVPAPLPMVRFRPNIVVTGAEEPFAEDRWARVRIGDAVLRFGEHCDRCVLPTIDPVSLTSTKEPTRTLARHRRWDHAVHFGVRLITEQPGVIRRGDPVTVL